MTQRRLRDYASELNPGTEDPGASSMTDRPSPGVIRRPGVTPERGLGCGGWRAEHNGDDAAPRHRQACFAQNAGLKPAVSRV